MGMRPAPALRNAAPLQDPTNQSEEDKLTFICLVQELYLNSLEVGTCRPAGPEKQNNAPPSGWRGLSTKPGLLMCGRAYRYCSCFHHHFPALAIMPGGAASLLLLSCKAFTHPARSCCGVKATAS